MHRERSRALLEAAQRLAFQDPIRSAAAQTVLHVQGALSALRAITNSDAKLPADVLSAAGQKPGLVSEAQADMLRDEPNADDLKVLNNLHLELLQESERLLRQVRSLELRALRIQGAGVLVASAVVLLSAWGTVVLAQPKDLAKGKAWRISSIGLECNPREHKCGDLRTDIFFHTKNEQEPWFEFDLATPTSFSSLTIRNRMDMGVARASPLVIEATDDHVTWKELARQVDPFITWTPSFPSVRARYVRVRVLKKTWLHLEGVEVHP